MSDNSVKQETKRIGILLADLGKFNIPVLKFLVLYMNTLQQTFEYEFLPIPSEDTYLQRLSAKASVDRTEIKKGSLPFIARYQDFLKKEIQDYNLKDTKLPDSFILITLASFEDNYYNTRVGSLSIIALGNWEKSMAPPSIIEFILTLVLRESIPVVCPSLKSSIHLGTKGCICDFDISLDEVKFKVLDGFVCSYCRAAFHTDNLDTFADNLAIILKRDWLGKFTDPDAPAGIAFNLGYNLFRTKGSVATKWESFLTLLQQEGVKQVISIIGAIIQTILITLLILWLGLKK